jgi:uncharacterized protein (DUF433 family)
MTDLLARITVDPEVCDGKPCIKGTRIWVSLILDFLAGGASEAELLNEYPQLTRDDVLAAIAYGAENRQKAKKRGPVRVSSATGGLLPGVDITKFSDIQGMDDLEYAERLKSGFK